MKAILLAAGFGTRLRPLTNNIPKCLVPIKGKALLEIWLDKLSDVGVKDFLINTHYLPEKVENFIKKSKHKNNCKIVYEKELLGTAGTLLSNLSFIDNECILIHADNYCEDDLTNFIGFHKSRPPQASITVMCFRAEDPSKCGVFTINNKNIATSFFEKVKSPPSNLANGAVYILSLDFIKVLKSKYSNSTDFSLDVLPNFVNKIYCYETEKNYVDIGTPENYKKVNNS